MVDLSAAIEGISSAESLEDLERLFPDLCRALGISHLVYHSLRTHSMAPQRRVLLFTYQTEWVGRYFAERYIEIDPVISHGRRAALALDWSELPSQTDQVGAFFRDAERHGVGRQGLTVPIRGFQGERALFTLNSTATPKVWDQTRTRHMPEVLVLAHLIHERAMQLSCARLHSSLSLSPRERECLQLAARGRIVKVIAYELGISESAVNIYLKFARFKLGASTLAQAVASAVSMEMIEL